MPIRLGGKWSFATRVESTGEQLLNDWLNLGTWEKAQLKHNANFPEDKLTLPADVGKRIKLWMTWHPEESIAIIQKYDPKANTEEIYGKIMFYAVRQFRNLDAFLEWAKDKPWTKPYEKHYREYYALRSL